jgi:ribulose 1,5-bisphosphate synthetase/thiazole synthase
VRVLRDLTGAYYLALDGIDVDVYEELPVLGGEVAVGVPEYRMPIDKYNQDIEAVRDLGVKFITNSKVTADMMRLLRMSTMRLWLLRVPVSLKKCIVITNVLKSKDTGEQLTFWIK